MSLETLEETWIIPLLFFIDDIYRSIIHSHHSFTVVRGAGVTVAYLGKLWLPWQDIFVRVGLTSALKCLANLGHPDMKNEMMSVQSVLFFTFPIDVND